MSKRGAAPPHPRVWPWAHSVNNRDDLVLSDESCNVLVVERNPLPSTGRLQVSMDDGLASGVAITLNREQLLELAAHLVIVLDTTMAEPRRVGSKSV